MTGNRCVAVFGICVLMSGLAQARTVRITGQVVDTETSPVAGAALALYEVHYAYGEGQIRWKPVLNQTSDAVGKFAMRFESQHDNDFMLIAYKSGLSLSWQRLRRRENIVNCLLRLNRPGILAGTVLDADGRPIAGARLQACVAREGYRYGGESLPEPDDWFWTTTDESGRFLFDKLPEAASADLWVEAPEKAGHWGLVK